MRTQGLIRVGRGRINRVGDWCFVTLDGNVGLARAALVVIVDGVSAGDVTAGHVVLLFILVVG